MEAGSRGNTIVPVIITSETRVQWSTLNKEVERMRGAKNEFRVENKRGKGAEKENSGSMMNTSCT